MKITKITIVPENFEVEKKDIEVLRMGLKDQFKAKIYFETSGETVAEWIIEKEMKNIKK
jgi:hypothetical protein